MISTWRRRNNKRSYIFLALSTLIVLVGGTLTLLWQAQQSEHSQANAGYIVGAPTLTAASIEQIFARAGSPMVGTGAIVEQAARSANIDDAFALAVWWTETNDGAAGVGRADRNPGSVRGSAGYPRAFDGYTIYPSYAAAIGDWFTLLRTRYVNQGLTSVYTICYPYVGTSGAMSWANKVTNLMLRYNGGTSITSAPIAAVPPTPRPNHNPKPESKPIIHNGVTNTKVIPTVVVRVPDKKKVVTASEHKQEILKPQHRPTTIGLWQGVMQPGSHIARNKPGRNSIAVQKHANGIFTADIQQFLIVVALLATILAILPFIGIRRKRREHTAARTERVTGRLILIPPLLFNQYSPVAKGREEMMRETGPLKNDDGIPATPLLRGISTVPLTPFVASRASEVNTVPLTPFVARHDGKERRSGNNDTVLKRARLVPVEPGVQEAATEMIGIIRLPANERASYQDRSTERTG